MKVRNYFFLSLVAVLLLTSCGSNQTESQDQAKEMPSMEDKKYPLSPFSKSPAYKDARLSDMNYQGGNFSFKVTSDDYKLGEQTPDAAQKMCANSGKGQHIHLIIDSQPYAAKYTSTFEHDVADGQHNVLAFLSRSYHESIKTDDAHIAKQITVKDGSIVAEDDITGPTLFYSRPKGTYVGDDTKKVMLDFYPINAEIGEDYKLKVQINGEVTILDSWQPYFIEGLPMGQNTIGIALVYPDGSQVPGQQTAILRTIELRADPLPEM